MKSIVFISRDKIGERMAGTAQRYVELARAAGRHTSVGLIAPPGSTRPVDLDASIQFISKDVSLREVADFLSSYEVWFSQTLSMKELLLLRLNKAEFIYDGYDPVYIENLERLSYELDDISGKKHLEYIRSELKRVLLNANYIVYATPAQKHYLLGQLQALQGLSLGEYRQDHIAVRKFVSLPFGMHAQRNLDSRKRDEIRKKIGVSKQDQLALWGGGIWNWFDPLTLLESLIKGYAPKNTKLYFPGFRHPDPHVPQMQVANDVVAYLDKHPALRDRVIIAEGWTPYARRNELFGIADVGLSLHYQSLETELAFRTRVLEYLAHEVPILSTEGDYFAEEIKTRKLGEVVPYLDPRAIGLALHKLQDIRITKAYKKNIIAYRKELDWSSIIKNLIGLL